MPIKGSRYIKCPECNRKRYCTDRRLPDFKKEWTCSKGHKWIILLGTSEIINQIMLDTLLPKVSEIFNRDEAFYRRLKK